MPAPNRLVRSFSARLIWGSSTTRCPTLVASFHSIQQFTLVYPTRRDTPHYLTKLSSLLDSHFSALHSPWCAILLYPVGLPRIIPPHGIFLVRRPAPITTFLRKNPNNTWGAIWCHPLRLRLQEGFHVGLR